MTSVLRIENLSVVYRRGAHAVVALQDVSLSVAQGEVSCVLGPNGAGKTTLLKCICQLVTPSGGQIIWPPEANLEGRSLNTRLGVLLEGSRAFYWNLTGLENARYFAAHKGLSDSAEKEAHLDALFALLNLTSAKDRLASTYSTGMKKRLSLIIALLGNPSLLILDEPTQGLDTASVIDLKAYLRRIAATGTAVLCTTHDLAFAFDVATCLWYLEAGRMQVWDWQTASVGYNQVVFLLAGDDLPASLVKANGLLTILPGGRVRLAGCIEDRELYGLLWRLILEHRVRVLQVYGRAT